MNSVTKALTGSPSKKFNLPIRQGITTEEIKFEIDETAVEE